MSDGSMGYFASTTEERAMAAEGRADALQAALIVMMRVISQGLQGQDAYDAASADLKAEAEQYKGMSELRFKAQHMQLEFLASVFAQK